ncbi:hypothetical protein PV05_09755 [Exophiala xenobiotica]|uniref:Uncharacterized protein n=1 Tax=Exophiala xenobiotica TaxID=348802 RepID=A0A0D2ET58_9EURO|nr:uncharacterized protein PV05_09755 [Exophiala xenobiotica]KIW50989.1 hypothetical protein PV05_09755 [Exophiala xenobiotica]
MSDKYSDRHFDDYSDKYRDRHADDLYEDRREERYEDVRLPYSERHVPGVNDLMSGGLGYGSSTSRDRSHLYEDMDKAYSTKATIRKWYDSELYPRENAPYLSHASAQKLRVSAYEDDEEVGRDVWKLRDEARQKVSLDNYNSSKALRRNDIDSRDLVLPAQQFQILQSLLPRRRSFCDREQC